MPAPSNIEIYNNKVVRKQTSYLKKLTGYSAKQPEELDLSRNSEQSIFRNSTQYHSEEQKVIGAGPEGHPKLSANQFTSYDNQKLRPSDLSAEGAKEKLKQQDLQPDHVLANRLEPVPSNRKGNKKEEVYSSLPKLTPLNS